MILGSAFLIILYLIFRYIIAWITYFNNLDPRLGDSTWRFTYDYPVVGERDISDLDDKDFVRLRRKKNKIILLMYSIVLVMFVSSMILGSAFLIILYLIFRYIIAWITYFNNLDPRLGDSTWRFTYDYPVVGERDISDLDDKDFVRLRRKKNKIILFFFLLNLTKSLSSKSEISLSPTTG